MNRQMIGQKKAANKSKVEAIRTKIQKERKWNQKEKKRR